MKLRIKLILISIGLVITAGVLAVSWPTLTRSNGPILQTPSATPEGRLAPLAFGAPPASSQGGIRYIWGDGLSLTSATVNVGCGTGLTCAADTISINNSVVPTGSGTPGNFAKWATANTLGDAPLLDDGSTTITSQRQNFNISTSAGTSPQVQFQQAGQAIWIYYVPASTSTFTLYNSTLGDVAWWSSAGDMNQSKNMTVSKTLTVLGSATGGPAANIAAIELQGGRNGGTCISGSCDFAFQYSGAGGGYRHWIATNHDNGGGSLNYMGFYINNSATAGGSSAPGTGNALALAVYGDASTHAFGTLTVDNNTTVVRNDGGSHANRPVLSITNSALTGAINHRADLQFNTADAAGVSHNHVIQAEGNLLFISPDSGLVIQKSTTVQGDIIGGIAAGSFGLYASSSSNGNILVSPYGVGGALYLNYGGTSGNGGIRIYDGATTQVCSITSAGVLNCVGGIQQGGSAIVSGTLNRLAKFTPDGSHLGDSSITDSGTTISTNEVINGISVGLTATAASGYAVEAYRGAATLGAAKFGGSTDASYFALNANEDTFIRPGKAAGTVWIGDNGNAAVGIGSSITPTYVYGYEQVRGNPTFGNDGLTLGFTAPEGKIASKNSSGSPASNLGLYVTSTAGATTLSQKLYWQGTTTIFGGNTRTEPTSPLASLEFFSGRDSTGASVVTTGAAQDIAFNYGGNGGGYRHWISTWHDGAGATTGNQIKFYVNTGVTAGASSAPGAGNVNVMSLTGDGSVYINQGCTFFGGSAQRCNNSFDDTDSALYLQYYNPAGGVVVGDDVTRSHIIVYGSVSTKSGGEISTPEGGYKIDNVSTLYRSGADGSLYLTNPYSVGGAGSYHVVIKPTATGGEVRLNGGNNAGYGLYVGNNGNSRFIHSNTLTEDTTDYFGNTSVSYGLSLSGYVSGDATSTIFQNAYFPYASAGSLTNLAPKWRTTHGTFGSRGIAMLYAGPGGGQNGGIAFYADGVATTANTSFTPTLRMIIENSGNVGVNVSDPFYQFEVNGVVASNTNSGATPSVVVRQSGVAAWSIDNPASQTDLRLYSEGYTGYAPTASAQSDGVLRIEYATGLFKDIRAINQLHALNGLSSGSAFDISDTFQAAQIRKNVIFNSDALTSSGNGCGGGTGPFDECEYGSTITYATATQVSPRGISETVGRITFTGGSADFRAGVEPAQTGVNDVRGQTWVASFWAKAVTTSTNINLTLRRYADTEGSSTSCTINSSSWVRCEVSATWSNTSLADNGRMIMYIGDASLDAYVYGAQLEQVPPYALQATPYQKNDATLSTANSNSDRAIWGTEIRAGGTMQHPLFTVGTGGTTVGPLNITWCEESLAGLYHDHTPSCTNSVSYANSTAVRITTTNATDITGLTGGVDGRKVTLFNVGIYTIGLYLEYSLSTAANRIAQRLGDVYIPIPPNSAVELTYRGGSVNRWEVTGSSGNSFYSLGTTSSLTANGTWEALSSSDQVNFYGSMAGYWVTNTAYATSPQTAVDPGSAMLLHVSTTVGAGLDIQGITGGRSGRWLRIHNDDAGIGASENIRINHDSGAATAANRIYTPNGSVAYIPRGQWADFVYDSTISRWRMIYNSAGLMPTHCTNGTLAHWNTAGGDSGFWDCHVDDDTYGQRGWAGNLAGSSFEWHDEFVRLPVTTAGVTHAEGFWQYNGCTGANQAAQSTIAGHPGVTQLNPGSTGGLCSFGWGSDTNNRNLTNPTAGTGIDTWILDVGMELTALSDGTTGKDMTFIFGAGDTNASLTQSNWYGFAYDDRNHLTGAVGALNAAKWECWSKFGGTTTACMMDGTTCSGAATVSQSVAVNTWYHLQAKFNQEAQTIEYYVNGTLSCTINTNLPFGTGLGPILVVSNSSATGATPIYYFDWVRFKFVLGAERGL